MTIASTLAISAGLLALAAAFVGLSARRQAATRGKSAVVGPAPVPGRGAFLYGELPEHRAQPRQDAGGVSVFLSDEPDHTMPIPAKVIDRSAGGLRLEVGVPVMEGTAIWVRAAGEAAGCAYRVRWCRKGERNWQAGCQADAAPPAGENSPEQAGAPLPP